MGDADFDTVLYSIGEAGERWIRPVCHMVAPPTLLRVDRSKLITISWPQIDPVLFFEHTR